MSAPEFLWFVGPMASGKTTEARRRAAEKPGTVIVDPHTHDKEGIKALLREWEKSEHTVIVCSTEEPPREFQRVHGVRKFHFPRVTRPYYGADA